jgi:hypothetical protein
MKGTRMKRVVYFLALLLSLRSSGSVHAQTGLGPDALIALVEQARIEMNKLQSVLVQEGWESDREFASRKASLVNSSNPAAVALRTVVSALESKVFIVPEDRVTLIPHPFDREAKSWTFDVVSEDPAVPYKGKAALSIRGAPDMKAAFDPVDAAIKAGTLDARIEYSIAAVDDTYYKKYNLKARLTTKGLEDVVFPLPQYWLFTAGNRINPKPPVSSIPTPTPAIPLVSSVRGTEAGNSYDMTIDAAPGMTSRSLYVPIALYMPLPYEIPASVHDNILYTATRAGNVRLRMEQFAKVYEQSPSGSWRLKREQTVSKPADAIFEQRPAVWMMLEESGYDVRNADYKTGTVLRDVTILFKLSRYTPEKGVILEEVYLERSSGMSTIDDAILYGFRKAQFKNASDQPINGRFVYRF